MRGSTFPCATSVRCRKRNSHLSHLKRTTSRIHDPSGWCVTSAPLMRQFATYAVRVGTSGRSCDICANWPPRAKCRLYKDGAVHPPGSERHPAYAKTRRLSAAACLTCPSRFADKLRCTNLRYRLRVPQSGSHVRWQFAHLFLISTALLRASPAEPARRKLLFIG